ncbi:myo-inosose-2 dehydratase [Pseudoruegeria sp. HB172150]|uniref:myo-inosose-2 dehydratase n=1 Tax=Pseudoruegeria sp. HB172150 TaxID=2721164 RepID=UPI001552639A|nr:myo-inosose-2 dehydratase [Pseudoruegeria sp. HB172150]
MAVQIGISLIAWQNDDLPDLTAAFTTEGAMEDAGRIGYAGVERGRRMPADTDGLREYLDRHGVSLCGGWFSGEMLSRSIDDEKAAMATQVQQFAALGAPCIVYGECSNSIQGELAIPVSQRPRLSRDEITSFAGRMTELAKWSAGQGMPLAYHHHMGSVIQAAEDIDWLMDGSGPDLTLCFDTGHLLFAGSDPLAVLDRWGERVHHVHFKDVRPVVLDWVRTEDKSFLDGVRHGVFTVPGDPDGCFDFGAVTDRLARIGFYGWIVVEAEQDPEKAPPFEYSKLGFEHIKKICAASKLVVAG